MPGEMMEPAVLYLIRHAEPEFGGGERICLGRTYDPPLSEAGKKQAADLAEKIKACRLDAVYSSPMLRARQTADMLMQECPRFIAPELTEVGSGIWEGMRFSEIYKDYPGFFDLSDTETEKTPPGGESDEAAVSRGMPLLNRLAEEEGKHFALVTHSGLGRILLCHLLGMPTKRKREIPMKYASCSLVTCAGGIWTVKLTEELIGSC